MKQQMEKTKDGNLDLKKHMEMEIEKVVDAVEREYQNTMVSNMEKLKEGTDAEMRILKTPLAKQRTDTETEYQDKLQQELAFQRGAWEQSLE